MQLKSHGCSRERLCAAEVPQLFVKLLVFRTNLNVYYSDQLSRALHATPTPPVQSTSHRHILSPQDWSSECIDM